MNNLKLLYYFSADEIEVIEVKRLGLENASPSETYKWLVIDKDKGKIEPLTFVSMNKYQEDESRNFEEGSITFNETRARLKYNDETYELENLKVENFPTSFWELVQVYLLST